MEKPELDELSPAGQLPDGHRRRRTLTYAAVAAVFLAAVLVPITLLEVHENGSGDRPARQTADPTPVSPDVLGPDEDDGLRLGMSIDEVRAAGGWVSPSGDGPGDYCRTVNPKGVPEATNPNGTTRVFGYLSLQPDRGVVALFARRDQVTPRGIRIGSTLRELRTAYPEATRGGFGSYDVRIDASRRYRFDIEQGDTVREISLVLDGPQGCYE